MRAALTRPSRPVPECATGDSGSAVELALAALEPALRRAARRLTRDADLLDDLIQEARICLWELDPTRFDLTNTSDLRYVCRALINRMWAGWRAEVGRGVP